MSAERLYRGLLRLYPRSFRVEYEREMVRLFQEQLRDARASGRLDEVSLWLRAVADVVSTAPGEYVRAEKTTVAKPVDPGSVSMAIPSDAPRQRRLGYALASLPFALLVAVSVFASGWMEPIFLNPPGIIGSPVGIVAVFVVAVWASLAFVAVRLSRSRAGIVLALVVFTVPSLIAELVIPAAILVVLNLNV